MQSIFYYDKSGRVQSEDFDRVFNQWVKDSGGSKEVIRSFKSLHPLQYDNIPVMFLLYFQDTYGAKLPEEDDKLFQDYLHHPDIYITRANRLIKNYEERSTSPSNILWIIFVALALFGLISTCS